MPSTNRISPLRRVIAREWVRAPPPKNRPRRPSPAMACRIASAAARSAASLSPPDHVMGGRQRCRLGHTDEVQDQVVFHQAATQVSLLLRSSVSTTESTTLRPSLTTSTLTVSPGFLRNSSRRRSPMVPIF